MLEASCATMEAEISRKNDEMKQLGSDLREKSALL
jgi:hypothetical protein